MHTHMHTHHKLSLARVHSRHARSAVRTARVDRSGASGTAPAMRENCEDGSETEFETENEIVDKDRSE